MKKIFSYFSLMGQRKWSGIDIFLLCLLYMVYPIAAIFGPLSYNYPMFMGWLGIMIGATFIERSRQKEVRLLPVSDRFTILQELLFWPALCIVAIGIMVGGMYFFFLGAIASEFDFSALKNPGTYVTILFLLGIWFLGAGGQFCKNKWIRLAYMAGATFVFLLIYVGVSFYIKNTMTAEEVYEVSLGEKMIDFSCLTQYASPSLCLLGFGAFALLTFFFSYASAQYYLRRDTKGQKHMEETDAFYFQAAQAMKKSGKQKIIWVVEGCLLGLFIMTLMMSLVVFGFLNQGGEDFDQVCTQASEYGDWNQIPELEGKEESLFEGPDYAFIFPDDLEESQILEYYSRIKGSIGDEWSSTDAIVRYCKASFSEEDFQEEKERVSGLTVTLDDPEYKDMKCYGETHGMLEDTQHFPYTTYIAAWDYATGEYEYAMFDDQTDTVYYVFAWCGELNQIETEDTIAPDSKAFLSEEVSNDGKGNYNMFSFDDGSLLPVSIYAKP